jgi:surface carbohydrate biosynthesis protein (TIGR04326 family)
MKNQAKGLKNGGKWFVNFSEVDDSSLSNWDVIVDFSGYSKSDNHISLPRYLYDNQARFMENTAIQIDKYGSLSFDSSGLSISDYLRLKDDFSLWDISGASEKCIVRNPDLADYLKLLAVEDLLVNYQPASIGTNTSDARILNQLEKISQGVGIKYESRLTQSVHRNFFLNLRVSAFLRFSAYVIQIFSLLPFRFKKLLCISDKDIVFLSYSDNLKKGSVNNYDSLYWNGLSSVIDGEFDTVAWTHIYDAASGRSRKDICKIQSRLESLAGTSTKFILLDQFLSMRLILNAFLIYVKLQLKLPIVERAITNQEFNNSVELWPFIKSAWDRSMKGGSAVSLIVQKLLIDRFVCSVGEGTTCVYLFEGMAWERMLLHSWRRANRGPLYGYQHTTIKSLDLRPLTYLHPFCDNTQKLLPDKLLVNSLVSMKILKRMGFSSTILREIEATRYNHLAKHTDTMNNYTLHKERLVVLIVLEGLELVDIFILELLASLKVKEMSDQDVHFIIKPHPNGKILVSDFMLKTGTDVNWEVNTTTMEEALIEADVVCVSVNSSATVDACNSGLPLVLIWKPDELIRSSLQEVNWSEIVTNSDELKQLLMKNNNTFNDSQGLNFYFSPDRFRWKNTLSVDI